MNSKKLVGGANLKLVYLDDTMTAKKLVDKVLGSKLKTGISRGPDDREEVG